MQCRVDHAMNNCTLYCSAIACL